MASTQSQSPWRPLRIPLFRNLLIADQLPAETLGGAAIAALRYVRYSPDIQKLLFRSACVIFFSSAFWALLPAVARGLTDSSIGYGLLLGFFGVGAVIGAVVLQRARGKLSVERVVSGATAVFASVVFALATLHRLPLLCFLILFGGAAWTVFMSTFNALVQNLAPDWVRARVLAIYLFVFQGSVALGSALSGVAAEHTSANTALLFSSIGIAACLALPVIARLPAARGSLEAWNHWGKLSMVTQPEPDEGPVLVAVEYRVDPEKVREFPSLNVPTGAPLIAAADELAISAFVMPTTLARSGSISIFIWGLSALQSSLSTATPHD